MKNKNEEIKVLNKDYEKGNRFILNNATLLVNDFMNILYQKECEYTSTEKNTYYVFSRFHDTFHMNIWYVSEDNWLYDKMLVSMNLLQTGFACDNLLNDFIWRSYFVMEWFEKHIEKGYMNLKKEIRENIDDLKVKIKEFKENKHYPKIKFEVDMLFRTLHLLEKKEVSEYIVADLVEIYDIFCRANDLDIDLIQIKNGVWDKYE